MNTGENLTPANHQQPQQHILGNSGHNKQTSQCFVVDPDFRRNTRKPGPTKSESLQEAFLKFRRNRQINSAKNEIRQNQEMKLKKLQEAGDPAKMEALRKMFLQQAKKYFGVPYARKYWGPEDPEYESPLFLDCCGLVRQVMRDLAEDFGFQIGSWNQAYMYDTLPMVLTEQQMKPGDLVFISATYFNPKAKRQRHDMVHVEIWLGDGPKTIGARWQKGKVQIFPHYAFEAKSYHSPTYHFRSIDTWLRGICHSYCSQHPWRKTSYDPNRHSIFAIDDESEDDESAGDTDDELVQDTSRNSQPLNQVTSISSGVTDLDLAEDIRDDNGCPGGSSEILLPESSTNENRTPRALANLMYSCGKNSQGCDCSVEHQTSKTVPENLMSFCEGCNQCAGEAGCVRHFYPVRTSQSCTLDNNDEDNIAKGNEGQDSGANKDDSVDVGNGGGGAKRGGDVRRNQPAKTSGKIPMVYSLAPNMQPTFYIGGGNGVALVEGPLCAMGWKRIPDKNNENFRLRWVECKSKINYSAFREGEQLVNHIPNCQLLTNKLGLINSLQEYERVTMTTKGRPPRLRMNDFVPETYRLDEKNDRETFLNTYKEGEIWICKPTGLNQGKGIYLIRSKEEITRGLEERDQAQQQRRSSTKPLMSRVIQRYIQHPLLLDGRKFDIRAYMLIASTVPYLVLYHKGYVRLSCHKYSFEDTDLTTHLTNQYIQKKDPQYQDVKEDTAWSMDKFNDYINEHVMSEKGIEENWVYNTLTKQMQKIMVHCFHAVKHKLQCKIGYFDLYGLDFMIDEDMKVSLIEININPSLATNCEALREVIPGVVEESIHLTVECFEKSRRHQTLLPLKSLQNMVILHCGTRLGAVKSRTTRSVSPGKETTSERSKALSKSHQSNQSNKQYSPSSTSFAKDSPSFGNNGASLLGIKKSSSVPSAVCNSVPPQQPSARKASNSDSIKLKMTHGNTADKTDKTKDTSEHSDRGN
ncbi:uncharacterized protein LOC135475177 [Liolophura sinensis]|uniref:uncharacterized protein LOC135475177 n=1 Tax=Liolophura sinensis TaxID=3198878 RepID=UPI0031598164